MILAGDIGGTKAYLGIFDEINNRLEKTCEARFESRDYSDFDSVLEEFLNGRLEKPEIACLGVAGPIEGGNCELTNLGWKIESARLKEYFDKVFLINDLAAMACAVPFLGEEDVAVLQAGLPCIEGRVAVLAAGTGLGQAFLFPTADQKYYVVDSEGGHSDFSPRNKLEAELLVFLEKKFSRVSVERVISGPGLIHIFEFFKEKYSFNELDGWKEGLRKEELASEIIRRGQNRESEACEKTLQLFVELYGALAGNLALQFLSNGGVFLGGGIAPRILPLLKEGSFMESFLSKGRFENRMKEVPVKVILDDKSALHGAAQYALGQRFIKH
ncbi:MAG: glucokinase [Nitrospinae bacterium]|nr:glucokinase [Nitrospinota bacterium]MZH04547.1 glucokinase [Nitrospinota bacterium]MZH15270.1 glucokinase [Nitrospinota bacterium]